MQYELTNFCEIDKNAITSYCRIHNENPDKNLGDISAVNVGDIADCNVIVGGSPCLVGNSLILTRDGYKQLIDMKPGDMVLSHDNKYHEVVNFMEQGVKDIYELTGMAFDKIEATLNHKFYVRRKKSVLRSIDGKRKSERVFFEPEWKTVEELMQLDDKGVPTYKNYYMCSAINQNAIVPDWQGVDAIINGKQTHVHTIDINDSTLWYLVGRYLGDGWLIKKYGRKKSQTEYAGFGLCCNKTEIDELREIISDKYHYTIYEEKTEYKLNFYNPELAAFFAQFGTGSISKNIPGFVYDLPISLLHSLLTGYFDSDGCYIEKTNLISATSINKNLIYGISHCVVKAWRRPVKIYFENRPATHVIEGRTVNQKPTYRLKFHKYFQQNTHAFYEHGYIWYPIQTILKTDRKEEVYDIEVKDSHSFIVNNCISHNCTDFSVAGKRKGAAWTCSDCGHKHNPLEVHYTKRGTCPVCGSSHLEKTCSSLIVEYLRMIREKKPNFAVYENVKNIIGKEFKTLFNVFLDELHEYGYNTYYQVLNAKHFGIPQNRERVILVIIKKELDNGQFKFPEAFDSGVRLIHVLEKFVDKKYYVNNEKAEALLRTLSKEAVENISNTGSPLFLDVKPAIENAIESQSEEAVQNQFCVACRGRYKENPNLRISGLPTEQRLEPNLNGTVNTLTSVQKDNLVMEQEIVVDNTVGKHDGWEKNSIDIKMPPELENIHVYANCCIRRLTPLECYRLMGFSDEDFYKAQKGNTIMSDTALYKQAGNSIVTNVLYYTYLELYKAMPYLFDDVKLLSLFSGIGAFEKAFYMLKKYINDPTYVPNDYRTIIAENKPVRVGQVSSAGSQAGTVYSDKNIAPTICAGTHGYAIGYICTENFTKPPMS